MRVDPLTAVRVVQHPRDGADAHAGQCRDARDRAHSASAAIGSPRPSWKRFHPSKAAGRCQPGAVRKLPPPWRGERDVVARRRPVPDLSALVRGHQRRRRSATCAGSSARLDHLEWLGIDGIWLNPTMPSPNDDWGYDVADYCAVAPGARHARGPRRADRRGGPPRHPRPARPRPQPHQRPPRVVPGRARRPRRAAPRLLRVGGPEARRLAAQQLAELVRRAGVDARRGVGPVLPAQLPAHAARPELVERGRPRGVRRDPALLVRPRDRGLAHRRHPRHRQGPRAARRPRGDRGRPPARSRRAGTSRCSR